MTTRPAPHAELLAHMRAVEERLTTPHWFSHTSAAAAWGCWTWRLDGLVHVTQLTRPAPALPGDVLRRHVAVLPQTDRCAVDGLPVTSLARTVLDCARTLPEPSAVVVADSALAAGLDVRELEARLDAAAGGRGVRRARRVVAAADGASESVLESLVRWSLVRRGLPRLIRTARSR